MDHDQIQEKGLTGPIEKRSRHDKGVSPTRQDLGVVCPERDIVQVLFVRNSFTLLVISDSYQWVLTSLSTPLPPRSHRPYCYLRRCRRFKRKRGDLVDKTSLGSTARDFMYIHFEGVGGVGWS